MNIGKHLRKGNNMTEQMILQTILEGIKDIQEGRYFQSTGDWRKDREIFKMKENNGWK